MTPFQTDGLDLLKAPWGNCVYYSGDYIPYNSSRGSEIMRSLDRMTNLFPLKTTYRGEVLNNALGFIQRFETFMTQFIKAPLIDPITAVTSNPNNPNGIGYKLAAIWSQLADLRKYLDQQDQGMVTGVANAWEQDQQALLAAASSASSVMKQAESTGTSLVNQEMSQMYQAANSQARNNDKDISRLANMEIQQSNSTVRAVTQQAQTLYRAANATIGKANALYANMNGTLAALQNSISQTALGLSQVQSSVTQSGSTMFVQGQNGTSASQNQAGSSVDQSLQSIASSVSQALNALTSQESRNVTSVTNNLNQVLNQLSQQITAVRTSLQSTLSQIQSTTDNNYTSTMGSANAAFQKVASTIANANNALAAANTSFTALQAGLQTKFATLDTQLQQSFANQTQQAQLTESALEAYMQNALNQFTGYALNQTNASSAQLSSAYDSAMAAATGGSGALQLTFAQRQKLIAALQGWQQQYAGNTNQLAGALTSTYGGLITDTRTQLQQAIAETSGQISQASASQLAMVQQAIASAQGNPNQMKAILAQFGRVGSQAAASAQQIQGSLSAAAAGYSKGMSDATDMLTDLQAAANATGQAYQQANDMNANATRIAQAAVYNTTQRIGLMNTLMQQYSSKLAAQIFNASSSAEQAATNAGNNASGQASAAIQAKMAQVQQALAQALATGQTSTSDLAAFAASVGANATMLSDLANSIQGDSSDAVAQIVQAKADAIDQLKSQVDAQLGSLSDTFDSQTANEQANLASLIAGLQEDLNTQTGGKTQLLTQSQSQLQALYGSMTTSQAARAQAQKSLDDSFTAALGNATISMAQLTRQITAQKSQVSSQISAIQQQINSMSSEVNQTIADANSSAQGELASLQAQGNQQVASVQKAIADTSATVNMMVNRFEAVIRQNMDTDTQQRISENSRELGLLMGVNTTLNTSQSAQANAIAEKTASAAQRANNLAAIIANLSGAGLAAQNGSDAFQAYVVSLANSTGVNMADLVNAMKSQVSDQKSGLYKLLSSNNIFVNETLQSLASASAGVQQGVVTGATSVMARIRASMNSGDQVVAGRRSQLGSLANQTSQVVGISSQQLAQLMTILTSQNALQQTAAYQSNQAVFNRIAGVADALDISTDAMYEASNATNDAIEVAGNATDDVDTYVNTMVQNIIASASGQEATYLDQASADYSAIMTALNSAQGFTGVFQNKLQSIQDDINSGEKEVEGNIAGLNAKIAALQNTIEGNTQSDLTQLNNWAQQAGPSALNILSKIQAQASAAASQSTTTTTKAPATTTKPTTAAKQTR